MKTGKPGAFFHCDNKGNSQSYIVSNSDIDTERVLEFLETFTRRTLKDKIKRFFKGK